MYIASWMTVVVVANCMVASGLAQPISFFRIKNIFEKTTTPASPPSFDLNSEESDELSSSITKGNTIPIFNTERTVRHTMRYPFHPFGFQITPKRLNIQTDKVNLLTTSKPRNCTTKVNRKMNKRITNWDNSAKLSTKKTHIIPVHKKLTKSTKVHHIKKNTRNPQTHSTPDHTKINHVYNIEKLSKSTVHPAKKITKQRRIVNSTSLKTNVTIIPATTHKS